jgi:hypothetical protein
MNSLDKMEDYDYLAKLCEKLSRDVAERDALIKEKNAALSKAEDFAGAEATIESLNLRVARLVDVVTDIARGQLQGPSNFADYAVSVAKRALSSESDSQWLREKQATLLESTIGLTAVEIVHKVHELREE